MKPIKHSALRTREAGFSLIEVLVSVVIMTLGLVGASMTLMNTVNNASNTEISERATQLAYEMMDAMRANRINASSYVTAYGTTPPSSTATVANMDLKSWLTTLQQLPGGDGKIEKPSTTSDEYLVTVRYTNCLGSLSSTELSNCKDTANTNSRKRELAFRFNVWNGQ